MKSKMEHIMSCHSIIFKNVTKKYKMYDNPKDKLKGVLLPDKVGEDFFALQNVSFTAQKGDVIGVIGVNGAGKSTLSNLIAGITSPTSGEIELDGQASLIAINSGLNGQLTGRENIELKCLMLGFSKKETEALLPDIKEFADIGKFIDQPVKNYSSGMKSRLGFAISININPDVLVIDEALSVGDQTFASKCLDKMNEFKERGKTIFFISHSIGQVKKFCSKALWLEAGMVKAYGTIEEVVPEYQSFLKEYKAMSKEEKLQFKKKINEKRSKLAEKPRVTEGTEKEEFLVTSRVSRSKYHKRKAKNIFGLLIILTLVGVGLFTGYNLNLIDKFFTDSASKKVVDSNSNMVEPSNKAVSDNNDSYATETQKEHKNVVQFVNVRSAYVRTEHELNSEAASVASFGSPYKVIETYSDEDNDMEWLKVTSAISDEETGWISSKLLSHINQPSSEEDLEKNLTELFGFDVNQKMEILGENEGNAKFGEKGYTVKKRTITSVTSHTVPVRKDLFTQKLNAASMELSDALLYVKDKYYYVVDFDENGNSKTLTVGIVPET